MSKIRIQKTTNGHFCSASEWAIDFAALLPNGDTRQLCFPMATKNILQAHKRLSQMRSEVGPYLTAMRIAIECGLVDFDSSHGGPAILWGKIGYNGLLRGCRMSEASQAEMTFDRVRDRAQREIEEQIEICRKLDATDIEA